MLSGLAFYSWKDRCFMTTSALLAFGFTSLLIAVVPGPTVIVIVAKSLRAGTRAEFLTKGRVKIVERISGTLLIGGGLWMALLKRA